MVSKISPAERRAGDRAADEGPDGARVAAAAARAAGTRPRLALWAAVTAACAAGVLVAALLFGQGGPPRGIVDLPTAGPLVTWSLPVVRLLLTTCGVMAVGTLLAAVVLVPARSVRLAPVAVRCVRAAGRWALGWAGCAVLLHVLTLADIVGVPLTELAERQDLVELTASFAQGRAMVLVELLATAIALGCRYVSRLRGAAVLLAAALVALVPPLYAGHSASAADHDLAVSSMMVHGMGVAAWAGGLAAILLHLRDARDVLPAALTRFSALALGCFAAAGASGAVNIVARLEDLTLLVTSRYGLLVIAKVVLLAALGGFGLLHRRRTIAAVVAGRTRRPFLRLATGELAVMAGTLGLAVALSRTPPPAEDAETSWIALQVGYHVPPLQGAGLLTEVRPDLFILVTLAGAGLLYAAGVRRLRRRGTAWPVRRALRWYAGLGVLAVALLSGVGAYGRGMFSVHAVQFLAITVVAPLLLAGAAPITLGRSALGLPRPEGAGRWLTHPAVGFLAYALPVPLFHFTGWFVLAQWSYAVHVATVAVFLCAGFLYFRLVLEADPPAVPLGAGNRLRLLIAGLPVHLLLAAALMDGPVVGEGWYLQLGLMWASPGGAGGGRAAETLALAADQRVGAVLGGTGAALIFLAVLVLLWLRDRKGRRSAEH